MIGPGSYKYSATLTFLFSLSKHLLLCPDMVWLSTFYLVCTNYGWTIQCSPNCCYTAVFHCGDHDDFGWRGLSDIFFSSKDVASVASDHALNICHEMSVANHLIGWSCDIAGHLWWCGGLVGCPSSFCVSSAFSKPSHLSLLTGGRISWWKDVTEPPDAWRQLTNAAAAKTAQRRYERLSKTVNIARIANAVKVTLSLSVSNPQCHD